MAFPKCPSCPKRGIPMRRAADEVTPAEANRYRSYRCSGCGRTFWTVEHVICSDAETDWLGSKFGVDLDDAALPSREAPASAAPEEGARTSGPRTAPDPLSGETRGIRGAA